MLIIFALFFLLQRTPIAFAIEDPASHPNNKVGIHILFPSELEKAAKLVNSNGGDWGYVTIPIQSGDKDLSKWQNFMDMAGKLHVIPIIRLATEGDYFNTQVWRRPTASDVLDFANFLSSLTWPTKNRYVVIFNEVNRANEWGGTVDPAGYADLLTYASTVFKLRSPDFFIISAGLDNASVNTDIAMNEYTYLEDMESASPDVFNHIDGIGSHSYPNPGFSQPPTRQTSESVDTFSFEQSLISDYIGKKLPVFITETGWSNAALSPSIIASYYTNAFNNVWSDPSVIAVTPFLLDAETAPFSVFSFLQNGHKSQQMTAIEALPKIKGDPTLTATILGDRLKPKDSELKVFVEKGTARNSTITIPKTVTTLVKWLLKI